MRQYHGKNSWPWWNKQIISKWANDFWRLKMENSLEETIFDIERDRPMSWFLKQKDRLAALHPDMSETMVHKKILRKSGGDLDHAIRKRWIETCSTEDYINAMEEITTRTQIGRNWYKTPMDNKASGGQIPKPNKTHDKAPLKCHKCESTSHLANTCPKKTRINEIEIEKDDKKETNDVPVHESDSEPSEEEELPDELSIENINVAFEVTEVHTYLPQYTDECMDLIHVQDAKMHKTKPAIGKGYTAGSSCISNIVINNREAKINLDSGTFCTCFGKHYLDNISTNWQDKLMSIEGIKFSSAGQSMHPLGIFEAEMVFPHPAGSIRLKLEFFVMNNFTSKYFILGNDYLNICGIDIINHKDSPELTPEMKEDLIGLFFQYMEAFASDDEPLGAIKVHEVERPYPSLLRRPAYPASPRAREAWEIHINELMKLAALRKVGHNEEVEVTTPVIIT
ncbi:hypothetical protein O181_085869 [Austropuccinia psidii MF-1]|uniref:CCHC-type domain-containing protein n=1 Tax=Austropuccinia psidii MF-1 TaxID=1389203 RepID=A0A9Q3FW49_9BASI|nr:hypothetical protein [Austropuccinia psidii MF-1]